MEKKKEAESRPESSMELMLPCDQDHFAEFISGLLGKPQTISKRQRGNFDISHDDIVGFYHLMHQRVSQQNKANLVQFTVKVIYNDGTSILHSSLESFEKYNEVRPVWAVAVVLSWTYLILFQNNAVPEKQEVEVCFDTSDLSYEIRQSLGPIIAFAGGFGPSIAFQIRNTEWTWGADIEGRLSAHIKSIVDEEGRFKAWLRKNSGWVAFVVAAFCISAAIVTIHYQMGRVEASQASLNGTPDVIDLAALFDRVSALQEAVVSGVWERFAITSMFNLLVSMAIAITSLLTIVGVLDGAPPSFISLTAQSEKHKRRIAAKASKRWLKFIVSLIVSVLASVAANFAYAYIVQL